MMSASPPRVYAKARRAARAGTFGRRNLTGRHAYRYNQLDIENHQPAPRQATASPASNSDKENGTLAWRRNASRKRTALLQSEQPESKSPSEERDDYVYYKEEREAESRSPSEERDVYVHYKEEREAEIRSSSEERDVYAHYEEREAEAPLKPTTSLESSPARAGPQVHSTMVLHIMAYARHHIISHVCAPYDLIYRQLLYFLLLLLITDHPSSITSI